MKKMADLPEEAIDEILLRLPVKSILRFECVCKAWRSLISAHDFAKRHLQQPRTQARGRMARILDRYAYGEQMANARSYGDDDNGGEVVNMDYPLGSSTVIDKILPSCDGLVCLIDRSDSPILWNPSTRKLNRLPNPNLNSKKGHFVFGFGYDRSSDEYKIMRLAYVWEPRVTTEIDIFGLKTGEWRRAVESHPSFSFSRWATFHNGSFYWLACHHPDERPDIVSFDMEHEKLKLVATLPIGFESCHLIVIGGMLSVIYHDNGCYEEPVRILRVEEESGKWSWTSLFNFPQEPPLWCWGTTLLTDGKELIFLITQDKTTMHNVRTGKNEIMTHAHSSIPIVYTETLISPHATKEARTGFHSTEIDSHF